MARNTSLTIPIAVFLSGGGRTLANLLHHCDKRDLPIDIRLVIGSRDGLRGLQIASEARLPSLVVPHPVKAAQGQDARQPRSPNDYSESMFSPVRESGATHVVMAGFLKHVLIPDDFSGRVINIHPSLLPKFGGQGMYGDRVHRAVLESGDKVTGCTVHYVDNIYDNGPMILQRTCSVHPDDDVRSLAARVFEQECLALPDALRQIAMAMEAENQSH